VTNPDGTATRTADGGTQLRFVRKLHHPVAAVWQALTDPEARAVWFFAGRLDPHAGGSVELTDAVTGIHGRVLTVEPPYRLAIIWNSADAPGETVVEFVLADHPDGCVLTLTHTVGKAANPDSLAAGWHILLDDLPRYLQGDSAAPAGAWPVHLARYREKLG